MVFAVFYTLFVVAALAIACVPVLLFALVIHVCSGNEVLGLVVGLIACAYCWSKFER